MLSKPNRGWSKLKVSTIKNNSDKAIVKWNVSYLTNVPVELMKSILNFYKTKLPQICTFDLEEYGIASMIILDECEIQFMNVTSNRPTIYRVLGQEKVSELIDEIIGDIENHINEWASFHFPDNEETKGENLKIIQELIGELKIEKREDDE